MEDVRQAARAAAATEENGRRPVVSLDPATGEVWARHQSTSPEEVARSIRRARAAQPAWRDLELDGRRKVLRKAKRLLFEARDDLAALVTRESGKPQLEALTSEVLTSLDYANYYLKVAPRLLRPRKWRHQNLALLLKSPRLIRHPWGVVGIITPWNYPFQLIFGAAFPALLCGNSVVVKPSEYTTSVALWQAQLLHKAGVPEDVFQVLPGDAVTGAALLGKESVDKIFLVGSEGAGRHVGRAAGERFVPATLELGGSDPLIVLKDAPLEVAAAAAVWSRFMNAGQTCVAIKRVFVEEPQYEPFVARALAAVAKLRLGPGRDPDTDVGPMIRESQVQIIEKQLAQAVSQGAQIRCGGRRRPDLGPQFFEPTILTGVRPEMAVMQEETFGPIMPIIPVRNADEAVEMANATRFGLSATIFSRDTVKARRLALRLQAGTVAINDVAFHAGISDSPYGGFKSSGLGKSHGPEGLLNMVKSQYIDVDPLPGMYKPWWFPYSSELRAKLDKFASMVNGRSLRKKITAIPAVLSLLRRRHRL